MLGGVWKAILKATVARKGKTVWRVKAERECHSSSWDDLELQNWDV